jgi:4-hydroxy-2-oxoheptanedioate aldolase
MAKLSEPSGVSSEVTAGGPPAARLLHPGAELKRRLRAAEPLIGGTLSEYVRPSIVELYAQAGFDFLYLEYEHGFINPRDICDCVLAARRCGLPVVAKTPQLERGAVAKLLESGVVGIQLPRTESREELLELVQYVKFPPVGSRAVATGYGQSLYRQPADLAQWMTEQDDDTCIVAHIETRRGFENAEQIVTTPGVDVVFVGPADFSVSMGYPGQYQHPELVGAIEHILQLCRQHSVPFGIAAGSAEGARQWIARGAQFFETPDELTHLLAGASRLVTQIRGC